MRDLLDGSRPRNAAPSLDELRSRRDEIYVVCARNRATKVWVFGSVARADNDELSDLDLLVQFEPGAGVLDMAGLAGELEELLGCPVDITDADALRDNRFGRYARRDMVEL